jgi:hypothetical protein
MKIKQYAACVAAALAFGLPGVAFAEDTPQTALIDPEVTDTEAKTPDASVDIVAIVDTLVAQGTSEKTVSGLSDEDLGDQRGGEALAISNQTMIAISSGSVLNGNYNAGDVSISDNALSNFNGFGNVVINTGAQNNLQSGMNLTINVNN